jgi:hypothetical protein
MMKRRETLLGGVGHGRTRSSFCARTMFSTAASSSTSRASATRSMATPSRAAAPQSLDAAFITAAGTCRAAAA